jgi:hypothetical protein
MITPQELSAKEQSKVMSKEETDAMKELEIFIDSRIKESYTRGKAYVPSFTYRGIGCFRNLKEARKEIIQKILFDKYRESGWSIKFEVGEDDGPNRPGMDYWIFSAK